MIANVIHQIEYLFSWNDALPNDVELTFVVSALDQCKFGFLVFNNRIFLSFVLKLKIRRIKFHHHFILSNKMSKQRIRNMKQII